MANQIKDTDYLFLSTRVHVLQRALLTQERMDRMLEAPTNAEAAKVLVECGYPEMPVVDVDSINAALAAVRDSLYRDLNNNAPDPKLIDVFKLKYDYHNAKTLLKAEAMKTDPARLLVEAGRFPSAVVAESLTNGNFSALTAPFAAAIREAREILSTTHNPQLSDFALDRAYFAEMLQLAKDTGSDFLVGYVQMMIDVANLRSLVRVLRMGKNEDYLKNVLFDGGTVAVRPLLNAAASGGEFGAIYGVTPLAGAAEAGEAAIKGGSLTTFEKACDNAVMDYVSAAKYVSFGEAPVVGYLVARDNEFTAVRIIMTGRLAGLSTDLIRERLREAYV
ncbi:MAG: V-type ATPase subunit [Clostridiales bacterium]|nr:V-type ATPase subunit [Clostridiales bacterium]